MRAVCCAILLLIPRLARASDWDWSFGDYALEAAFLAEVAVDWHQTLNFPPRIEETNPLLSKHPSSKSINLAMGLGAILHVGVAAALPKPYRIAFQSISVVMEGGMVVNNARIGISWHW